MLSTCEHPVLHMISNNMNYTIDSKQISWAFLSCEYIWGGGVFHRIAIMTPVIVKLMVIRSGGGGATSS